MKKNSFLLIFVLMASGFSCAADNEGCKKIEAHTQSFISTPTFEEWDFLISLPENPPPRSCDCALDVAVYYMARIRMNLPNSHSLEGITPNQFVEEQKRLMSTAVHNLQNCKSKNLYLLIDKMKNQDFDPDVERSAEELGKQLKSDNCFLWFFNCD